MYRHVFCIYFPARRAGDQAPPDPHTPGHDPVLADRPGTASMAVDRKVGADLHREKLTVIADSFYSWEAMTSSLVPLLFTSFRNPPLTGTDVDFFHIDWGGGPKTWGV